MPERPWPVILLPGSVMPVGPAYDALLAELGPDVDARAKELEVYATDAPPPGYSLSIEVDGITRVADATGFDRFHLVGYSGGGAACLAYTAQHPERLLSLALMEPAFAGWQLMSTEERAHFEKFRDLLAMDGPDQMARFQELQRAPGVPPVPPQQARRRPGWRCGRRGFAPSLPPSCRATWISTPFTGSTARSGTRSAD